MAAAAPKRVSRVILVTGANRGIGLAVVEAIAARHPRDIILLAARSLVSLNEAKAELANKLPAAMTRIQPILLDVTSDLSVASTTAAIAASHGRLDALINNAGVAILPNADDTPAQTRAAWARTFDTNISSIAALSEACLPLLKKAQAPRIINVSSGRASLTHSANGDLPPTKAVSYSVSKTALNMLTVELGKNFREAGVAVLAVNPGHCKTRFNGFRGTRSVADGAKCIVDMLDSRETEGFWESKVDGGKMSRAAW